MSDNYILLVIKLVFIFLLLLIPPTKLLKRDCLLIFFKHRINDVLSQA